MIQRLSHACIYVLDQEAAREFYVDKLGFKVHTDAMMGDDFRWLTVTPPGQPDLEIILMPVQPGFLFDEEAAAKLRSLVADGKIGPGVFHTADCRKTHAELSAKGVEFMKEPTEEFYGVEAIFKDNSGNWFSMTEQKGG